jgi:hypothetical protein
MTGGNHPAELGLQNCEQITPSVGTLRTPKQADQQSKIAILEQEMRDGLAPHNSGSYMIVKREEMQTLTQ